MPDEISAEPLSLEEAKKVLEAVLFASGHAVTFKKLGEVMNTSSEEVRRIVNEYVAEYDGAFSRGIQLLVLGNACQLATKEEYAPYVRSALGVKEGGNLSKSSLETLAVIILAHACAKDRISPKPSKGKSRVCSLSAGDVAVAALFDYGLSALGKSLNVLHEIHICRAYYQNSFFHRFTPFLCIFLLYSVSSPFARPLF